MTVEWTQCNSHFSKFWYKYREETNEPHGMMLDRTQEVERVLMYKSLKMSGQVNKAITETCSVLELSRKNEECKPRSQAELL